MDYNDEIDDEEDYNQHLPKRTDARYKRIENFKPYELTHCIIFEMAGRNKEVRQLIKDIISIKKVQDTVPKIITPNIDSLFETHEDETKNEIPESVLQKHRENKIKYNELIKILKNKYYIYFDQKAVNIPEIENPFKEKDFSEMSCEEVKEDILDALKTPMMKHISGVIGKFLHGEEYQDYKSDHQIYEGFVTARGIDAKCKTFNISSINTHFQRKIYDINQINVTLNMSLPEDELVEYIKQIKRTLSDKNEKELKSSNKLLGKNVQEAEKTKNYPKKPTASKLADMFYVYDYVTTNLNNYSSSDSNSVIIEIFDDIETAIPTDYYLRHINKKYLDLKNDRDNIFNDLVSPLYRETIKLAQRKYKKATIHIKIDKLLKDFKSYLDHIETSVIQKKYSEKIDNSKENKIFEDLEMILHRKHIKNLHEKYAHIEMNQREKIFTELETILERYKISSSTISNYYYALKPYIEECRYSEFLTGESIIEEKLNEETLSQ